MANEERREHEDRVIAAINGMQSMLGGQITSVQNEVRALKEENNHSALANVRTITQLEGRLDVLEKKHDTEVGELKSELKPLQQAFWKWTGISAGIAILIGVVHEIFPLFKH